MPTASHITQAQQAFGKNVAAQKIPTWHACEGILYPPRLSMEQCSSEWTARYKASLISGNSLVDLTGGLGIDCYFLSQQVQQATYIEQQTELCQLAAHNFVQLGQSIAVINQPCEQYLSEMPAVDVIYIDPARRNQQGGKTVCLSDCTPDLTVIGDAILAKCRTLLIKLSPMIDIESVVRVFPQTTEVHIVSVKNECKEVLVKIDQNTTIASPFVHCVQLNNEQVQDFCYPRAEEGNSLVAYGWPQRYLYEPNASILKAGAFKQVAQRYCIQKLHPNSHLYTSENMVADFPGRTFCIDRITKVQRKEIADIDKANLSIRNFPGSVADLRKKLKLKDGGDVYIFATTLQDNAKVLIVGRRV